MTVKQSKIAFGSRAERFNVSGIHPQSKLPGSSSRDKIVDSEMGPGYYNVALGGFSARSVDHRAMGPGWARAAEVERMAAVPHLLYKEQWQMKKLLKKKLGPGTYEHLDFLELSNARPCSTRGILQQCENRFKDKTNSNPGPGTYGKGGVPSASFEEKCKQPASTVGLLDNSYGNRSLPIMGSRLGPGTYKLRNSTQMILQHMVSRLAPFDQTSASRGKPLKTGHFARDQGNNLGPGQYSSKSFVEKWQTKHRKNHGKFGKQAQHPETKTERIFACSLPQNPRDPSDPGPGAYNAKDMNLTSQSSAYKSPPFLLSAVRCDKMATKFFTGNFNPVGPGRYDIQKLEDSHDRNGLTSDFKSKTACRPDDKRAQFLKERIREKDVPISDRVFLVPDNYPVPSRTSQTASRTQQRTSNSMDPCLQFAKQRAITVI